MKRQRKAITALPDDVAPPVTPAVKSGPIRNCHVRVVNTNQLRLDASSQFIRWIDELAVGETIDCLGLRDKNTGRRVVPLTSALHDKITQFEEAWSEEPEAAANPDSERADLALYLGDRWQMTVTRQKQGCTLTCHWPTRMFRKGRKPHSFTTLRPSYCDLS